MAKVNQVENNTIFSFNLVRKDMIRLQNEVISLMKNQEDFARAIYYLRAENIELQKKIKDLLTQKIDKEEKYVSSKAGKRFHIQECPFAQKIKSSNKIVFDNKLDALSEEFTACECVA